MSTVSYRKAVQTYQDIPQFSDLNNWRAGGYYKNETFAGGMLFSVENQPAVDSQIIYPTLSSSISSETIFNYIDSDYFSTITEFLSGIVDIYSDYRNYELVWIRYDIDIKDSDDKIVGTISGEYNSDIDIHSGSISIEDSKKALDSSFSLQSLASLDELTISGLITNVSTGKIASIKDFVVTGTIGSVKSSFSSVLTGAITKGLGITSFSGALAINFMVTSFVTELIEIAIGLDNHFGFGGGILTDEFGVVTNDQGVAQYGDMASNRSTIQNIMDMIATITNTPSFGDEFYGIDYSQEMVDSAEEQSSNSSSVDNPDWDGTGLGDNSGIDTSTGDETTNEDSSETGQGLGFL